MAEIGTTEAANALADYFGPHLVASHEEGRRLMAETLHKQFDIPMRQARRLVDELEQAHAIHWIAQHPGAAPADRTIGRVPGVGMLDVEGYWQLESE